MTPLARIALAAALAVCAAAAAAQTAMDTMAGMAATQETEKAMAGQARGVPRSAIATVFGAGAGAAAAPAAAVGEAPSAGPAVAGEAVPVDPATLGEGRRDPFRPFTIDLQRGEATDEVPLSPLQRYEIAQLRLTGLVLDLRPPRAMLQDSAGMGYIVTPGTPIGRRHGVVKSIEPGRIVVEETVLDYYGHQQVHQVVVEMPRDDNKTGASSEGKP